MSGWYSAKPGMTSLTIALGWNWAPVIVVVTYWLSPPWSICTFVIDSGSSCGQHGHGRVVGRLGIALDQT